MRWGYSKWLYSHRHHPACAISRGSQEGWEGACLKTSHLDGIPPWKKVTLESSCCDSSETHSGMFSFCVADDDDGSQELSQARPAFW